MERKLMDKRLVEELDVLCVSYLPPTQMPEVKKIEIVTENHTPKVLEEHTDLSDFRILGIDLEGTIAPYICKGQPIIERENIKGMRFWDRNREVMKFLSSDACPSMIGINDGFVYFGQGNGTNLLMFDKPLPFDPKKDFLYVRSPNGRFIPQNILAKKRLEEELILGEWIIFEERDGEKAVDYRFCDKLLFDYYQGKFKSLIRIYSSVEGIFIRYEKGGEPIREKSPDGTSWSPIGKGFRPVRTFSLPADISTFNPLTFDPSKFQEIEKPFPEKESQEREYSLAYINPAELTSLRWGFNSKVMEPASGGISRYYNQHLF